MHYSRKEAFEDIYHSHNWGGGSRSGPGSDPEHTVSYINFVNGWLERHCDCKSIVELGCGDWATTRFIHLSQKHTYLGLDIVQSAITTNQERFQSDNVRFECSDFLSNPPPPASLLLVKDVLQHLSNSGVKHFIQTILPRYRYAIITNDVRKYEESRRFWLFTTRHELQEPNVDIADGSSRPLKLDVPPFELNVAEKSTYSVQLKQQPRRLIFVKDILVWRNASPNIA